MVEPYATVADLEAWLGRALTTQEAARADALLLDASLEVAAEFPGVNARITAGTLNRDLVTAVVTRAVVRALRNPEGLRQESIGDYSYTRGGSGDVLGGQLTKRERALLAGPPRAGRTVRIQPALW